MISNLKPTTLWYRDGTGQADRMPGDLQPDNVLVEDRSIETLISAAQQLAKVLQFVDETNQPAGNWEAFLMDDIREYNKKSEADKAIHRTRWAQELAAYLKKPDQFGHDPEKRARLSKPHVALFLTFLRLLDQVKTPMNQLVKRHLDFYYLERLGLEPKGFLPDQVHAIVNLASDVRQFKLNKGTALGAGTDEDGNERIYTTNRDVVISEAGIKELRSVYVNKRKITIAEEHASHYPQDKETAFVKMIRLALGDPNPGDPLPMSTHFEDLNSAAGLIGLHTAYQEGNPDAENYITENLGIGKDDFDQIMRTFQEDLATTLGVSSEQWQEVYALLDEAFQGKVEKRSLATLRSKHQSFYRQNNDMTFATNALLKYVYGRPSPGDDLPAYRGEDASIVGLYGDFNSVEKRNDALAYITHELFLSETNFRTLHRLMTIDQLVTPEKWEDDSYRFLEEARRKLRNEPWPSASSEKLVNVYARADARATAFTLHGDEEESMRFRTFGSQWPGMTEKLAPATLGWAISSPILTLAEGQRDITLTIALTPDSGAPETLQRLFNRDEQAFPPFQVHLTRADGWSPPADTAIAYGNFLVGTPEGHYTGTISGNRLELTGDDLTDADVGKYLVDPKGTLYRIVKMDPKEQTGYPNRYILYLTTSGVVNVGPGEGTGSFLKYPSDRLYRHSLQLSVTLSPSDPPVGPIASGEAGPFFLPEFPALALSVNHVLAGEEYISDYQKLMDLKMEKKHLHVAVDDLKNLTLQNDLTDLDPLRPFLPFDDYPEIGSSCYLAHPEISQKRLDLLEVKLEWMNAPKDFKKYYENYWYIESNKLPCKDDTSSMGNTTDPQTIPCKEVSETSCLEEDDDEFIIKGNADFTADIHLVDGHTSFPIGKMELFAEEGTNSANKAVLIRDIPAYRPRPQDIAEGSVQDHERYVKLELSGQDFQHGRYQTLFFKQARSCSDYIKLLPINPPYTPKLKGLSVRYTSHTEMTAGQNAAGHEQLYHLHPFGYQPLNEGTETHLLPHYQEEGILYLGIENLIKPQLLSVLFQLAEGSANPEVERPAIQWAFLTGDQWVPQETLSDTTNGLLNSGIIQWKIPDGPSASHTALPGKLDWIRCTCPEHTDGLPDTIAILAQAVTATLSNEIVAPGHFTNPLPAGTINDTIASIPEIAQVTQPFTSIHGRPPENKERFYTRVSERIHHKQRTLALWDYERMILDRFPEIYKVKCVPGSLDGDHNQLGQVSVIVVPDIRGKLPFNPFEPKAPADTLFHIQQYLESKMPAYAEARVVNPRYLQVKTRFSVKFHPGYDETYYTARLESDLKRFLAPWAYDEGSELTLGGKIYAHAIVNFIAEQPYVDFVAQMKLLQSEDGAHFKQVSTLHGSHSHVEAHRPDMILVSAQSHEISLVSDDGYRDEDFEGINHMILELDFRVADHSPPEK